MGGLEHARVSPAPVLARESIPNCRSPRCFNPAVILYRRISIVFLCFANGRAGWTSPSSWNVGPAHVSEVACNFSVINYFPIRKDRVIRTTKMPSHSWVLYLHSVLTTLLGTHLTIPKDRSTMLRGPSAWVCDRHEFTSTMLHIP
jgi:hypothetical protein